MEHPQATTDEQLKVPEDNEPGHHPEHEQDKPDPEDFASRFNSAGHDDPGLSEEISSRVEAARTRVVPMLRDLRSLTARLLRRAAEILEPGRSNS